MSKSSKKRRDARAADEARRRRAYQHQQQAARPRLVRHEVPELTLVARPPERRPPSPDELQAMGFITEAPSRPTVAVSATGRSHWSSPAQGGWYAACGSSGVLEPDPEAESPTCKRCQKSGPTMAMISTAMSFAGHNLRLAARVAAGQA